jgi:hypothetical protein
MVGRASARDLRSARWLLLFDSSGDHGPTIHQHGANDDGSL